VEKYEDTGSSRFVNGENTARREEHSRSGSKYEYNTSSSRKVYVNGPESTL
jgi:hypothetical protein